jgi:hypothetical protein
MMAVIGAGKATSHTPPPALFAISLTCRKIRTKCVDRAVLCEACHPQTAANKLLLQNKQDFRFREKKLIR